MTFEKDYEGAVFNYNEQLSTILNRPLTPEIIDGYADIALNQLIDLIGEVVPDYLTQSDEPVAKIGAETEQVAFDFFKLGDINNILQHVVAKAQELTDLDTLIDTLTTQDHVYVPPDPRDVSIKHGSGEFVKPGQIKRLKTFLFVLSNGFGIDTLDSSRVSIAKGAIEPNMVREEPYYVVDIPELERTVLICDEEGNASFVFDREVLNEKGITAENLALLSKTDYSSLIEQYINIGESIIYSKNFVTKISASLTEIGSQIPLGNDHEEEIISYLHPETEGELVSATALSRMWGMSARTVIRMINSLGSQLGEVVVVQNSVRTTTSRYNRVQQDIIKQALEVQGNFAQEPPEGYISINGLIEVLGVAHVTISEAADKLASEIGDVGIYRFGVNRTAGYSPTQQAILRGYLEARGLMSIEAPEGYLSLRGLADTLGMSSPTVNQAINKVKENLGEVHIYSFGPQRRPGYSPEQQAKIKDSLAEQGYFSTPPEGWRSLKGMADDIGINEATVKKIVLGMRDSLGETPICNFRKPVPGYSPEQQAVVKQYFIEHGYFKEPPEGVLTQTGVAKLLKVGDKAIKSAVEGLGDSFRQTETYVFHNQTREGYTPEQQSLIKRYLEDNGYFNLPSDGTLSIKGVAEKLGIAHQTVARSIEKLEDRLGEIRKYNFGALVVPGLSPEQQQILTDYFIHQNRVKVKKHDV